MKNKYFILIGLFFLLITIYSVTKTYSLFETNTNGDANLSIGKWKIVLNNTDVTFSDTLTLSNFTYSSNTHMEDNYFAPGRSAEFVLEIDAHETDVSVIYNFEIDDSAILDYPNIYFSIEDLDTLERIDSSTISGVIPLDASNRIKRLKVYLVWSNELEYDESDSSLIGEDLEFNINANFKQYLGDI